MVFLHFTSRRWIGVRLFAAVSDGTLTFIARAIEHAAVSPAVSGQQAGAALAEAAEKSPLAGYTTLISKIEVLVSKVEILVSKVEVLDISEVEDLDC
jgi:hypothetical protein